MSKIRFDLKIDEQVKAELDRLNIKQPRLIADFIQNYQNLSIGKYDLLMYEEVTSHLLNELKIIELEQDINIKKQEISNNI